MSVSCLLEACHLFIFFPYVYRGQYIDYIEIQEEGLVYNLTKEQFVLGVTDQVLRVSVHQLLLESLHPTARRTPIDVAQQTGHKALCG